MAVLHYRLHGGCPGTAASLYARGSVCQRLRAASCRLARANQKGALFLHKKTELSLRFFFCRMPDRDQRREDPAASLLAGADFSVFSFSPLSVGDGLASLCGCASFDPV